jgi:hypothetical protein
MGKLTKNCVIIYTYTVINKGNKMMSATELQTALHSIRSAGFSAVVENDVIVVEDPVFSSGYGVNAGKLMPAGHNLVKVRTYRSAVKFINDRS